MAKITEQSKKRGQRLSTQKAIAPFSIQFAANNFKLRLKQNFFVRFHMTLILSAVGLSGVTTSKLLLEFGVNSMLVRYPIAVFLAYGVFFLLVKMWLWYVGIIEPAKQRDLIGNGLDSLSDVSLDVATSSPQSSHWSGFGGGSSGGGGASDSWGEAVAQSKFRSSGNSGGLGREITDAALGGIDLGEDGGCIVIVLLAILAALLFGIFGASIYLIYQSPVILAEAAFQAALAAGLVKASREIDRGHWAGSIFRATRLPFGLVLALALIFGWIAHRYCPAATKATEIFKACG